MRLADKKILVLGANGMLGADITKALLHRGVTPLTLDLPDFDITNNKHLSEAISGKDIVINCAAYTDVEKAESEPDKAFEVNADAVGTLGQMTCQSGAKIIHISTDFVFSGELDRPYCESDATNPINVYGQSKLKGEELLLAVKPDACIIRVEWTYGIGGSNFVSKMIELSKSHATLKVISDQIGSPTATTEAANTILELIDDIPTGVFHFAAKGFASRYDMAELIFDRLGIKVNLEKCRSSEYKTVAKRPLNSRFNTDKIQGFLSKHIRPWDQVLTKYLEQI